MSDLEIIKFIGYKMITKGVVVNLIDKGDDWVEYVMGIEGPIERALIIEELMGETIRKGFWIKRNFGSKFIYLDEVLFF